MNILCQMFKREVNDGRQMIIVAHNVDSEYLPNNKQYLTEPKLCIKWLFLESRKRVLTYVLQGLVSMDAQMFYPAWTTSNYYWKNIFQHANTTQVQLNLNHNIDISYMSLFPLQHFKSHVLCKLFGNLLTTTHVFF